MRASLFWSNVDLDSKNTLILMMPPLDDFGGGDFVQKKNFLAFGDFFYYQNTMTAAEVDQRIF